MMPFVWWHRLNRHDVVSSDSESGTWRDGCRVFVYRCDSCNIDWKYEIQ